MSKAILSPPWLPQAKEGWRAGLAFCQGVGWSQASPQGIWPPHLCFDKN